MDQDALAEIVGLYESGRLADAEGRCQAVLDRDPDQAEAIYVLGRIHLDRSDLATAILQFRRALQLSPDWSEAHANLGAALFLRNRINEATYHLRRATSLDSSDPESWNNLGVALQASGRANEALDAFNRALELHPNYPEALYNVGSVFSGLGQYSAARERYRLARDLDANNLDVLFGLGNVCLALGDFDAAEGEFSRALGLAPDSEQATTGIDKVREARSRAGSLRQCLEKGAEQLERGAANEAVGVFRQALLLAPDDITALKGLGSALLEAGRPDQAKPIFRGLVEMAAVDPESLNSFGVALSRLGEKKEAVVQFRAALRIDPDNCNATANLALTLADLGDAAETIPSIRRALELFPDNAELHNALGVALGRNRDNEAAVAEFEAALALDPTSTVAMTNLGCIRCRLGYGVKAVRLLRRALELDPNQPGALNNLALVYLAWGRREAGEELLRRALALKPLDPDLHVNLGMSLLSGGLYVDGWSEYEWRLKAAYSAQPKTSAPKWRGESNASGTLMVYAEQGFGDNIHFSRYLALVKRAWRGRVVYYTWPELQELFDASEFSVEVVSWAQNRPFPRDGYDAFVSVMSLPHIFGTTEASIPATIPYLHAPADRISTWRERVGDFRELKVGLVWAGNRDFNNDLRRTCDISLLAPLADVDGVRFYSLQKGAAAEQIASAANRLEMRDLGGDLKHFADTAAVITQLDLLISVDTAVVHLAGALGCPVWALTAFASDWRWLIEREDSPWYPTLRLYRQPRFNAWAPVWRRVADDLRTYARPLEAGRGV